LNDKYLIITGRFQPLHFGHIDFWKYAIKKFKLSLIVCILKNLNRQYNVELHDTTEFDNLSLTTLEKDKNPLPDNIRKKLIEIVISNDNLLKRYVVELRFREYPILDWNRSLYGLPQKRIWVFNKSNSYFDLKKVEFYQKKGEYCELLELSPSRFSGTEIRNKLKNGDNNFSFLPNCCIPFFKEECLKYFIKKEESDDQEC